MLGGWRDINPDDVPQDVSDFAIKEAVEQAGGDKHGVRVIGILSARGQSVAGKLYEVKVKTETTDCPPYASDAEIHSDVACPVMFYSVCTFRILRSLNIGEALTFKDTSCTRVE